MIYENGITLSHEERKRLEQSSYTQDQQIAIIMRNHPQVGFTFHDMVRATGFNQDSVKRSMSNMAGSGDIDKYKDFCGRFPIIKTEEKALNPDTGINITIYQWNSRFKQPLTHREIVQKHKERGGQMKFWEQ